MAVDDKKSRTPQAPPATASTAREAIGPSARSRRQPPQADATREELQRALAELQVYQHELELQNEEMRSIQQNLDTARKRYQDLFELAPVGYLALSDAGLIQEVNLTAAGLLGRTRAALVGSPLLTCIDSDCRALFREQISQHKKGLGQRTLELRLLKGERQRFWARLVIRCLQNPDGEPEFRVMLSDVSDLHAATRELHDTQLDLRRAQEMAKIGVWRISGRGAVILCSDETYRILGIPSGTDVNQTLLLAQVHPDDREWVAECRSRALRGVPYDIEHRLLVDGQVVWVREKAEARMDDNRRRPDLFGTLQDISDIKAIEHSLRDAHAKLQVSEARHRGVLDDLTETVARFRADGTLVYVNPAFCRTFRQSPEALLGRRWQPLVLEEDLPLVEARLAAISPANSLVRIENRFYDGQRQVRWGQFDYLGLFDEAEELIEFQAVGRDITEQKRIEARLRRMNAIIEASPDVIAIATPEGKLEYMNRTGRSQLGLTADEPLTGYRIEDFHAPEIYRKVMQDYVPAATADGFWLGETSMRRADGSEFPVTQLITAHKLSGIGQVEFLATICRDITQQKQHEAALRDSEAKFSAAFMDCPMGMAIMRLRDDRCLEANRRMLEIFDLPEEEALGKMSEAMSIWDDPAVPAEIFSRLQRESTVRNVEASFIQRRSGRKRLLLGSLRLLTLRDEPHALVIVNDVTEKRETETSLRALQAELQIILDTLPAHIFYKDTQDRLLRVNRTAAEAWGMPKDQIEGRSQAELFPDLAAKFRQIDEAVIASGQALSGMEHFVRMPNGEERWMRMDLVPRQGPDGRVTGLLVMATDITQSKLTEQELKRSRDDLNRAQAVGRIGSWRLDGETGALNWSTQTYRMFGIAPGTPIDYAAVLARLSPEDADRLDNAWLQAIARRSPYDLEYRLQVDGAWYWLREKGELEFDADGEFASAFGTIQDISELKHAEDALRREDRLKDEFLATLAHELRNPLAPLRNGIRVLQLSEGDAETCRQMLGLMEHQLLHMVRLLDDLLDMSRIRQGRIELHSEAVDLVQIVEYAVEANRSQVEDAAHQLTVEVPAQPVPVTGDPVRLAQVVTNLLSNAVKYTPRGGLITLRLAVEAGAAVVRVRDSGIGIPEDMLTRVFDLFTQVDQTYQLGAGGLGIGLNLAKRLVELHGGRIEALSRAPGTGSEFVMTLPMMANPIATQEAPSKASLDVVLRPHRVLLVDDNVSILDSLRLLLELLGQEVRCAHSGEEALNLFPSFRPELVLLDIGMPGLSGYETCRRLRRLPWGRGAVIVAMTGWAQEKDKLKSRLAGFNRHLIKPVDPDELERLLESLP